METLKPIMKDNCYNRDIIQAFLDGELPSEQIEAIACHVSICEDCSTLLQRVEDETILTFAALDEHFATLVPTERIRTNLYRQIAEIEKPKKSVFEKIFGFKFSFANPAVSAFASLLIVGGILLTYWSGESQNSSATVAAINANVPLKADQSPQISPLTENQSKTVAASFDSANDLSAPSITAAARDENPRLMQKARIINAAYVAPRETAYIDNRRPPKRGPIVTQNPNNSLVAGEDAYLKTIATLKQSVDGSKDEVLRPSARIAFEKDLATLDYAIKKTRAELRRNPKNDAAREMLRTSYQSKIDMLTTVADNSDLVASLR